MKKAFIAMLLLVAALSIVSAEGVRETAEKTEIK